MSKILITFIQPILDNNPNNLICYYEGLIKELNRFGNDVLRLNLITKYNKSKTLNKIKQFSPDVIFAFNNQIKEDFIKVTNCPIVLFDADSIDLFNNIDLIKKYQERYFMVTSYEGWDDRYSKLGFSKNRICSIHPATAIQSKPLEKDKNISFIGTNFDFNNNINIENFIKNDSDRRIYESLLYFWNNNDYNYKNYLKTFYKGKFSLFDLYCLFDSRTFILNSILDLGLNLYGVGWDNLSNSNYALSSAFIKEPKYSLSHNQYVYNSSKISISISHPQTNGYAFPWRIYDIMASSGMLISARADLLKKYTKGIVDIPMYDSPYDARDLCKKYLKEDSLREDIVALSNEYIEKFGRWQSNFEILEYFLGIKLISQKQQSIGHSGLIESKITNIKKQNKKFKNITNGIFLILSNIPVVEKCFSYKNKLKLYKSIQKNKMI